MAAVSQGETPVEWYPWIVTAHVLGAFLFVFGHGASAFAALRLRRERDPVRIGAMLDVSLTSYAAMGVGWLLLLIAGIVATFMAGLWGRGWIWVSLVVFVLLTLYMATRAGEWMRGVRRAIGMKPPFAKPEVEAPTPVTAEELDRMLRSPRIFEVTMVGSVGLAVIIGLMALKPF
jgi:hypothetical protein